MYNCWEASVAPSPVTPGGLHYINCFIFSINYDLIYKEELKSTFLLLISFGGSRLQQQNRRIQAKD